MRQRTERPDADNLMPWLDSLNKKERRGRSFALSGLFAQNAQ